MPAELIGWKNGRANNQSAPSPEQRHRFEVGGGGGEGGSGGQVFRICRLTTGCFDPGTFAVAPAGGDDTRVDGVT